jgi:O-antigen ligase
MFTFTVFAQVKHAQYGFSFETINDALAPFYRNHVNYSALLVCTVPLQIAIIRLTSVRVFKLLMWGALLISFFALYFSFARGAWLALVTGVTVYFLIRKKLVTWVFSMFFVFILGAVVWLRNNDQYLKYAHDFNTTIWHENFREHLIATYKLKDASTAERFYRWIAGVRMAEEKWGTGFGPSTFYKNYKTYTIPAFKTWVSKNKEQSTVHNYFLLMLIEQGAPALIIFLLTGFLLFWYAQRIYHRTDDPFWRSVSVTSASILVMIFTVNFLSDLIETDKVGSLFYLCVAALVVADAKTREGGKLRATSHELRGETG